MSPGPEGTPRYFAWLYSSARMQAVLKPLFGIETEVNAGLQPGLEHSVAHVRMTWWAEEAERPIANFHRSHDRDPVEMGQQVDGADIGIHIGHTRKRRLRGRVDAR